MTKTEKLLYKILTGQSDTNIAFTELCTLLIRLGFNERIKGDHHIFTRDNIIEIINLQPLGNMAKPYQVKQIRQLITKYKLGGNHGQA